MAPIKLSTEEARQAKSGVGLRYILAVSFVAAAILLIGLAYAFTIPEEAESPLKNLSEQQSQMPPSQAPDRGHEGSPATESTSPENN